MIKVGCVRNRCKADIRMHQTGGACSRHSWQRGREHLLCRLTHVPVLQVGGANLAVITVFTSNLSLSTCPKKMTATAKSLARLQTQCCQHSKGRQDIGGLRSKESAVGDALAAASVGASHLHVGGGDCSTAAAEQCAYVFRETRGKKNTYLVALVRRGLENRLQLR